MAKEIMKCTLFAAFLPGSIKQTSLQMKGLRCWGIVDRAFIEVLLYSAKSAAVSESGLVVERQVCCEWV